MEWALLEELKERWVLIHLFNSKNIYFLTQGMNKTSVFWKPEIWWTDNLMEKTSQLTWFIKELKIDGNSIMERLPMLGWGSNGL